ncbi:hypothetical protein FB567DRAFT_547860 [Paraphoma chrysanthemicola]|uniref:Uncharacterized protein n=1 Tax=Paraphoma chrysanthemicola TaxID=798071 RepID=A0A8K0W025_9PLEO|nr:hypothetical protein FB567DRAFT_547860 [Paraphoma chrysanthemicola]
MMLPTRQDHARPETNASQVSNNSHKEQTSFTLESILDKIRDCPGLSTHLSYVPEGSKLDFQDPGRSLALSLDHLIHRRLKVGTFRADGDTMKRSVYAYVHGQYASHDGAKRNKVSYFPTNRDKLSPQDVKKVVFERPFQGIDNLRSDYGQQKLRFLILFYFLEARYLEEVEFLVDGFHGLRKAIEEISEKNQAVQSRPVRVEAMKSSETTGKTSAACGTIRAFTEDTKVKWPRKRQRQERDTGSHNGSGILGPYSAQEVEISDQVVQITRALEAKYRPVIAEDNALKARTEELEDLARKVEQTSKTALDNAEKADTAWHEATTALESLRNESCTLRCATAKLKQAHDQVRKEYSSSLQQSHALTKELDRSKKSCEAEQKARKALEKEQIVMQNEMDKIEKLLDGEQEARKAMEAEKVKIQDELAQLKAFRDQFLQLTAPLKDLGKMA